MDRIRNLNNYQKSILIFMAAMSILFAIIYAGTVSRVGYRYKDAILVPTEENGTTVYSGEIYGEQAEFAVSDDTVAFRYGDRSYGPYTVKEDASAIPEDGDMSGVTGIEIREGDDILFRGGIMDTGSFYWFYNEDGSSESPMGFSYVTGDGVERDENGDPVDRMKPSASTIYELTQGPELTHKGSWAVWFGAVFICIFNALSILFADELFRLELAFQIRNTEDAEPSDWEIAGRYISWTVIAVMSLVLFIKGSQ